MGNEIFTQHVVLMFLMHYVLFCVLGLLIRVVLHLFDHFSFQNFVHHIGFVGFLRAVFDPMEGLELV